MFVSKKRFEALEKLVDSGNTIISKLSFRIVYLENQQIEALLNSINNKLSNGYSVRLASYMFTPGHCAVLEDKDGQILIKIDQGTNLERVQKLEKEIEEHEKFKNIFKRKYTPKTKVK